MIELQMAIFANVLALLALAGAFFGWTSRERRLAAERQEAEAQRAAERRENDLRHDDVFAWAKEAIRAMQSVVVLCADWGPKLKGKHRQLELSRLAMELSCLLEQGRLFFKNEVADTYGAEKEAAFRGYRPAILDQILIAYLVASRWSELGDDKKFAAKLVEKCEKKFLSLAQSEVGRDQTASEHNSVGGSRIGLKALLDEIRAENLQFEMRTG